MHEDDAYTCYAFSTSHSQSTIRLGHALHSILARNNTHNRHTRNLAHPLLQLAITRCHNVAPVLGDALDETVVGVGAFVGARQTFEARVACDAKGYAVLLTELFEFGKDTVGYARDAWEKRGMRMCETHYAYGDS